MINEYDYSLLLVVCRCLLTACLPLWVDLTQSRDPSPSRIITPFHTKCQTELMDRFANPFMLCSKIKCCCAAPSVATLWTCSLCIFQVPPWLTTFLFRCLHPLNFPTLSMACSRPVVSLILSLIDSLLMDRRAPHLRPSGLAGSSEPKLWDSTIALLTTSVGVWQAAGGTLGAFQAQFRHGWPAGACCGPNMIHFGHSGTCWCVAGSCNSQ
jgi:hypothetical protein